MACGRFRLFLATKIAANIATNTAAPMPSPIIAVVVVDADDDDDDDDDEIMVRCPDSCGLVGRREVRVLSSYPITCIVLTQ